uniref:Uncharacterized protein n=1 Tax=Timema cristinae TaxID=61476 RepID=A0A7R9D0X9_TIMCR|nr:unnamed protein product [Timema cristinae]
MMHYSVKGPCCNCRNLEGKVKHLSEELHRRKETSLEMQVGEKTALKKQHEAMTRAVMLAERNKQLEQWMRDIDHMALSVEAECNTRVQEHARKLVALQDQLEKALEQIVVLEQETLDVQKTNKSLCAAIQEEQMHRELLQQSLDTALLENKSLCQQINDFHEVENDLMIEIEQLKQSSGQQKLRIIELEGKLLNGHFRTTNICPVQTFTGSEHNNGDLIRFVNNLANKTM